MRPAEARPEVLALYRRFRQQGRTPIIAMQMVRSASIGIADIHHGSVDMELPPAIRSTAAMQSFVAGQYMKRIRLRTDTRPFWRTGFVPKAAQGVWESSSDESLADWELELLGPGPTREITDIRRFESKKKPE